MLELLFQALSGIFRESLSLFLALAPYLLLGFGIAGLLYGFIPSESIYHHLGGRGVLPTLKAALFGIPLPLCSCGVIPVAASLRKEGASKPATLSFLVSTPTTGVDSILATYSLLGPLFAIFRPLTALLGGLFVGNTARVFLKEESSKPEIKHSHKLSKLPLSIRLRESIFYGFGTLIEDVGRWILLGVVLGGGISYFVPKEFIGRYLGNPGIAFLFMLIIAVPLYVCATGSIPIAASLIMKGMSPGAALVFLIAGPATNTVTITVVAKTLGRRAVIIYLSSIIGFALLAGLGFNYLFKCLGSPVNLITGGGRGLPIWLSGGAGVILFGLILKELLFKRREEMEGMKYIFKVPDMSCKHCQMTIENVLSKLPGVERVRVNLETKEVAVDGEIREERIIEAIERAGYSPEPKGGIDGLKNTL